MWPEGGVLRSRRRGRQTEGVISAEVDRSTLSSSDAALGYTLVDQQGRLASRHSSTRLELTRHAQNFRPRRSSTRDYSLRVGVVERGPRRQCRNTFEAKLKPPANCAGAICCWSEVHPVTQRIAL